VWWSYPTTFLSGPAAAGAIGMINSIGNLGGFTGPYVLGLVRDSTGSFQAGLTLDADDVQELRILLARRDQHNQRLYRDIADLTGQLEGAKAALSSGLLGRLRYFAHRLRAR